ncbi:L-threonylcarbamoyladenylate synthase [Rhodococcus antarcticus]|uniref:L-threonylcarbamoyladenylate synthase n=1 Tax=Rhodococcus antarcticus TaxID=2987751 RepID=A0ABY6P1R8_9NOCA|nr:L-threonylcarbamoyladenylate synthase [Rhodococcus antarcticus]UZJ25597.1 L-threonylcarbamoyladenylate synthase [Rhodococcus antarcticus]
MSTVYDCTSTDTRADGLAAAFTSLRAGRLVVLPTDTLYGLGCDAFDSQGVSNLLKAKNRGRDMPVPVLVGSWHTIDGLVHSVKTEARSLVQAFWPGGLSLVVQQAPSLAWDLGDTRGTVMLRMPLHPVALDLLREIGPMAVSSANVSGEPPATTVQDARNQLGSQVDVYLDGGPCARATPSTIVDLTGDRPLVLREGAVAVEAVAEVLGCAADELRPA